MERDYLLDTTILSAFGQLKRGGDSPQHTLLAKNLDLRKDRRIFLCPIPVGEIQRGVLLAPTGKIITDINELLKSFTAVLPINSAVAKDCYAELYARLFKNYLITNSRKGSGKKRMKEQLDDVATFEMHVQENDLWLAAIAMSYKLILVTADRMERIKAVSGEDIVFENWLVP
ncbi:MAG: type II toxin-antitoxin system VapC family toxin [Bacteroidetes bacterium]|nr:MAG: type II toxin-antitoxin system VapC family toxin [Bacteroidota bacterium]